MHRVMITGIGAVTPLGNTFADSWNALLEGRSGIGTITRFDISEMPWKVAGEIKGFQTETFFTHKEQKRLDPFAQYASAAAIMASEDAGLTPDPENRDIEAKSYLQSGGVIIGSSRGGISMIEQALLKSFLPFNKDQGITRHRHSPYLMPATTISMAASYAAQKLGIQGYCLGISNACTSGTNAIGEAYRLIRSGYPGPVLAGGAEAPVCRLCIEGYGRSGTLSRNSTSAASRPFDRFRDGFVLAEGACVLAIENLDNALKRGARIYGEIIGYSNMVDAFHQTQPDAHGEARTMMKAIMDAGLAPDGLDHLNTHGTGTGIGDQVEATAIRMVFGERAETSLFCSATKSLTGHMIAASGAFEAACTAMTLKGGIIPPTLQEERDPACNINVITKQTRAEVRTALTASFGFGGVNAVLALKTY
jgi:3-oxoacyl-[acyl-carrier-protein] synthase II